MKKLLDFIVKGIVDHPEEVSIEEKEIEPDYSNFVISAANEDFGQIIGKSGKIIKALRTLLKVASLKEGKRVNLQLIDQ